MQPGWDLCIQTVWLLLCQWNVSAVLGLLWMHLHILVLRCVSSSMFHWLQQKKKKRINAKNSWSKLVKFHICEKSGSVLKDRKYHTYPEIFTWLQRLFSPQGHEHSCVPSSPSSSSCMADPAANWNKLDMNILITDSFVSQVWTSSTTTSRRWLATSRVYGGRCAGSCSPLSLSLWVLWTNENVHLKSWHEKWNNK